MKLVTVKICTYFLHKKIFFQCRPSHTGVLSERFEVISTSDNLFGVYFFK